MLDIFVVEICCYLGGFVFVFGGLDMIVFIGGIGENGSGVWVVVLCDLVEFGIFMDDEKN